MSLDNPYLDFRMPKPGEEVKITIAKGREVIGTCESFKLDFSGIYERIPSKFWRTVRRRLRRAFWR